MKHIFIVNPMAGKSNSTDIIERIVAERKDIDYEIYVTKCKGDAVSYVHRRCEADPETDFRFYACGGDGTIYEVANGIYGYDNASMTCFPCGSGNDFVKYYGGMEPFSDLEALIDGEEHRIDLLRINGKLYCINVTGFGFDTEVCRTMIAIKRKKFIGGNNAYYTGVLKALITAMKTKCRVTADGELLNPDGDLLLCTLANGNYVGGSFRCAPRSNNEDGLAEVCLVKSVSRLRLFRLISCYIKGTHLDDPRCKEIIIYRRAKTIKIEASEGFAITVDGEIVEGTEFVCEMMQQAIRFVVPRKKTAEEKR